MERPYRKLNKDKHENKILQRAWKKYGKEQFEFLIVELVENKEDLLKREQAWLDSTKCYDRSFGFNLCPIAGDPTPERVKKRVAHKKKMLLEMARQNEKPPSNSKRGIWLSSYISKSHACYDQQFDDEIRRIRPEWFVDTCAENYNET